MGPLTLNCTLDDAGAWVDAVAFSSNGRLLATASLDHAVRLYTVTSNDRRHALLVPPRLEHTLPDATESALSVAFSPSGRWLGTGSWDGKVRVYDLHDSRGRGGGPKLKHTLADAEFVVHSVAFSNDGSWLAAGSWDRSVRLYATARHQNFGLAYTFPIHAEIVSCVAFSADSSLLASASGSLVQLFSTGSNGIRRTADPAHVIQDTVASVSSLAFSSDGQWLAIGSHDSNVRLYTMAPAPTLRFTLEDAGDEISSLAFSPDSRLLASGSSDSSARVYDLTLIHSDSAERSGLIREQNVGNSVMGLAFGFDSLRLAVGSSDHLVHLYNVGPTGTAPPSQGSGHVSSSAPLVWMLAFAFFALMFWVARVRRVHRAGLLPTGSGDGVLEMAHNRNAGNEYIRRSA